MSNNSGKVPRLNKFYRDYLVGQETAEFVRRTSQQYTVGTLERLAASTRRETRRAAVLALGLVADYQSNAVVGGALVDTDRGVRCLAENAIVNLWRRCGSQSQQQVLNRLVRANSAKQFKEAVTRATRLISEDPTLAEAWNQRAVAHYGLHQYARSIRDCRQALEINAYHFGAASGMGQCYVQLGDLAAALECFRRALKLNPNLEGVRASVAYLERSLKKGQ